MTPHQLQSILFQKLTDITSQWTRGYISKKDKCNFYVLVGGLPYKNEKLDLKTNLLMKRTYISEKLLNSIKNSINSAEELSDKLNDKLLENVKEYPYIQTYNNIVLVKRVKYLHMKAKKLNWNEYHNELVLYIGIMELKDPLNKNRIICKIGWSNDIWGRLKDLKAAYGCDLHILGLKKGITEKQEKELHKELKDEFPEFIVDIQINEQNKTEIYVFDDVIYQKFLDFNPNNDDKIKIDKKIKRKIDKHFGKSEQFFQNCLHDLTNDEKQPRSKKRKLNTI
jgi:hypothetical protein